MAIQRYMYILSILYVSLFSKIVFSQSGPDVTVRSEIIVMKQAEPISIEPQIIGGVKANPDNWPSALFYEYLNKACSASVIGPKIILTAAHCIPLGAEVLVKSGDTEIDIECSHHPDYKKADKIADIALCRSNADISLPGLNRFERISGNAEHVTIDSELILLGFGCRRYRGGGSMGELFYGKANVKLPSEGYLLVEGGAAVCYGDSGGGAFRVFSPLRRAIIGVNSRGDLLTRSFITPFYHRHVIEFLESYAYQYSLKICGINLAGDTCVQ